MGCGTDLVSSLAVLFCSLRVVCDGQSTGPALSDLVGKCLLDESPRNSNTHVCWSSLHLLIITRQLWVDFNGSAQLGIPSFYEERGLINSAQSPFFIETALAQLGTLPNPTLVTQFSMVNLVIANAHKFGPHSNVDISAIPTSLFNTIIVDEAHHYPAATWKMIIDHFQLCARKIFLTATPQHRGGPIFDDVKICMNRNCTIRHTELAGSSASKTVSFVHSTSPKLETQKTLTNSGWKLCAEKHTGSCSCTMRSRRM